MKRSLFKFITVWMLLLLSFAGLFSISASADAEMRRVVIGADLSEEQIQQIYQLFGFSRGSVPELYLTNVEERAALDGFVEPAVIGTRAISSVYLELLPQNSGMSITTENISWCTAEMYLNALTTGGITDAKIAVAAPFSVSGTAALAGVYKAYEDMTGQKLDDQAKTVSTQELTITGELANEIGSADSTSIVKELKSMLNQTVVMSDDELRSTIRRIAEQYHVQLTDTQVQQLLDLCRALEKLNPDALGKRVNDIQNTLEKVSDAKDQVVGFFQTIRNVFDAVRSFFERINSLFNGR